MSYTGSDTGTTTQHESSSDKEILIGNLQDELLQVTIERDRFHLVLNKLVQEHPELQATIQKNVDTREADIDVVPYSEYESVVIENELLRYVRVR